MATSNLASSTSHHTTLHVPLLPAPVLHRNLGPCLGLAVSGECLHCNPAHRLHAPSTSRPSASPNPTRGARAPGGECRAGTHVRARRYICPFPHPSLALTLTQRPAEPSLSLTNCVFFFLFLYGQLDCHYTTPNSLAPFAPQPPTYPLTHLPYTHHICKRRRTRVHALRQVYTFGTHTAPVSCLLLKPALLFLHPRTLVRVDPCSATNTDDTPGPCPVWRAFGRVVKV